MSLHRFIVDAELAPGPLTVRDHEFRNQVKNVLRLEIGEALQLCDGRGRQANATLVGIGPDGVDVLLGPIEENRAEASVRVTLYCAVLKRDNFELVIQKATEAGAARIVPVVTARTVKTGVRVDRAVKIAKEAAEQCGRGVVPEVPEPMSLKQAMADAARNAVNLAFEKDGEKLGPGLIAPGQPVGLFVGPEGGWSSDELEEIRAAGFRMATLGPRTYRAETAAIIATHLLASL